MIMLLLGVICGALVIYLLLKPKIQLTRKLDTELLEKNIKLSNECKALEAEQIHRQELIDSLSNLIKEKTERLETESNLLQEQLATEQAELLEDYHNEYLSTMEDYALNARRSIEEKNNIILDLNTQIAQLRSIVNAAIEFNVRAQEEREKRDFYRIAITELDIQEIKKIREIEPYLRDVSPLNKVIWKSYYETPFNSMIGRVIGATEKTGIYKLTNLNDGKTYIGQAVKIGARWKEHVKKGIGADTPNRNKLYPAMLKDGVENFTFEVLEECPVEDLDTKEKFWIEYFQAKTVGYNSTAGG